MIKERRKYIRLDSDLEFTYKLKGADGPEEKSNTKNIGPGGICGLIDKRIKEGSKLELKITIPSIKRPIPATGKVIWTADEKSGKIDVGIKFEDIDPDMKSKFLEYICELMFSELERLRA